MDSRDDTRTPPSGSPFYEASFIQSASSPASVLMVRVGAFGDAPFGDPGGVVWSPLGNALPAAGDRCLVAESDDGSWWVLSWWASGQATIVIPKVVNVVAQSSVSLGAIDGENITGVRISADLLFAGVPAATLIRLKPNGLGSIQANQINHRAYWPDPGPATQDFSSSSGTMTAQAGLMVGRTDWTTGTMVVTVSGTMFTRATGLGHRRHYNGIYSNSDAQVNANNILTGRVLSSWNDWTTPITSLALSSDAGTFTGRIVVEQLP